MRLRWLVLVLLALSNYGPAQSLSGGKLDGGYIGPVVVGGAVLACDIGPFTSATSLATVNAQINGAADGKVVCLTRGQTWSSTTGLNLTTSHANSARVTICASTGTSCTDSGAANPRFDITQTSSPGNGSNAGGQALLCQSGAGGYTVKNLDATAPIGSLDNFGMNFLHGCSNVTIEGGKITNFDHFSWMNIGGGVPPNNILVGTCAAPQEWTGLITANRALGIYGTCTNCSFSVNAHDINVSRVSGQSHLIDIAAGDWTGSNAAHNLTVECSTFDNSVSGSFGGTVTKLAAGTNATFRDNTMKGCGSGAVVGFESHGADANKYGWDVADVYRNRGNFTCAGTNKLVGIGIGSNIHVYNNIVTYPQSGDTGPAIHLNCHDGNAIDNTIHDITINSNTIYRSGAAAGQSVLGDKGEACGPSRPNPTAITLKNNAILTPDNTVECTILNQSHGTCNDYGANGVAIDSNFAQCNASAPTALVMTCSADDGGAGSNWPKSGPTNGADGFLTSPNLVDIANLDFRLVDATSRFYKNGVGAPGTSTCPTTDYAGNAQTNPCTIGAFSNVP